MEEAGDGRIGAQTAASVGVRDVVEGAAEGMSRSVGRRMSRACASRTSSSFLRSTRRRTCLACCATWSSGRSSSRRAARSSSSTTDRPTARRRWSRATTGRFPVRARQARREPGPRARRSAPDSPRRSRVSADDVLVVTLEADTTSDLDALPRMLGEAARRRRPRARLRARRRPDGERQPAPAAPEPRRRRRRPARARPRRAHRLLVLPRLPRLDPPRGRRTPTATDLIEEPGFACKAELLAKLAALGARIERGAGRPRRLAPRRQQQDARPADARRLLAASSAAALQRGAGARVTRPRSGSSAAASSASPPRTGLRRRASTSRSSSAPTTSAASSARSTSTAAASTASTTSSFRPTIASRARGGARPRRPLPLPPDRRRLLRRRPALLDELAARVRDVPAPARRTTGCGSPPSSRAAS